MSAPMNTPMAVREKYFEELSDSEKIMQLANVVEHLQRELNNLHDRVIMQSSVKVIDGVDYVPCNLQRLAHIDTRWLLNRQPR